MAKLPADQEFLEYVVKQLVDYPDDVKVERKIDEMGVLLSLKVNPSDMGTVIGRQGATARALRTLLRVVGAKNDARVNLKLEEPAGRVSKGSTAESAQEEEAKEKKEAKKEVEDVVEDLRL